MRDYKVKIDGRFLLENELVEKILNSRGITDIRSFLEPRVMHSPKLFKNIDKAFKIVEGHITSKHKIGVLFDVDTDGVTAGTIITEHLCSLDVKPSTYINKGKSHGLRMDEPYWDDVCNLDLLIIVDSFNNSPKEYTELHKHGVDIVVLDHHNITYECDDIVLVSSQDGQYPNPELSGAGVAFQFVRYWDYIYSWHNAFRYIDLATVGIIADEMDMTNLENRTIASIGFKNLNNKAIKKMLGNYEFNSTAISFSIAPMINAANRLNKNELAMKALTCDDDKELKKIIKELKACKTEQDEVVDKIMTAFEKSIDMNDFVKNNSVLFMDLFTVNLPSYVSGLTGVIAQKLTTKYNIPTIVCVEKDGKYKGSIRNGGAEINFAKLINDTGLASAKGHNEAAGFSMDAYNYNGFMELINKAVKEKLESDIDITPTADVYLEPSDININLCKKIQKLDYISGNKFRPIRFLLKDLPIDIVTGMKDGLHLQISSGNIDVIKWSTQIPVKEYEQAWLDGKTFDCIGTLSLGGFGTPKIQIICDEIYLN